MKTEQQMIDEAIKQAQQKFARHQRRTADVKAVKEMLANARRNMTVQKNWPDALFAAESAAKRIREMVGIDE